MRFVYFIKAKNNYKVGVATDLKKRLASIQTGNGEKVELVCARRSLNALKLEGYIHGLLKEYGGNGGREWFMLTPKQAIDVAIRINKSPEVETVDLIIDDIKIDMKNIMTKYWSHIEKSVTKATIVLPAETDKQPVVIEKAKSGDDALFEKAIQICRDNNKASTSLFQRKLNIGYGRAARIMERLEEAGIVSPLDGIKPRQVLL